MNEALEEVYLLSIIVKFYFCQKEQRTTESDKVQVEEAAGSNGHYES